MKKQSIGSLAVTIALTMMVPSVAGATSTDLLVPIRTVADQLGANLAWDAATASATLTQGGKTLKVQVGSKQAEVDGEPVELSSAVALQDNRTYVPLDLLDQTLGAQLRWDDATARLAVGNLTGFTPQEVKIGSKATYDLDLKMNDKQVFTVTSKILVENTSADEWDKAVFYFIPNAFTEPYKDRENVPNVKAPDGKPIYDKLTYATVKIDTLNLNGAPTDYKLDYDTLTVPLDKKLKPGEKAEIEVGYQFTLPEPGVRFAKYERASVSALAQWYPMLATYNDKGWNKGDYVPYTESYLTGHSDFKLTYDLPEGYTFISSSDDDGGIGKNKGVVTAKQVKEIYAQVFNYADCTVLTKQVDGVEVRVFGPKFLQEAMNDALDTGSRALKFYRDNIGPYPLKQLDIASDNLAMEYPGIVTVSFGMYKARQDLFRSSLAHEIAHQYFYGVVNSDQYHEGWLDEGMTDLATSLFMYGSEHASEEAAFRPYRLKKTDAPIYSNQDVSLLKDTGISYPLYAQPVIKMWDLFKRNAGQTSPVDTGLHFLHDYYANYSFKQVSTPEFLRFAQTYFPTGQDFYGTWLNLK